VSLCDRKLRVGNEFMGWQNSRTASSSQNSKSEEFLLADNVDEMMRSHKASGHFFCFAGISFPFIENSSKDDPIDFNMKEINHNIQ
jgi:hypothetical protein